MQKRRNNLLSKAAFLFFNIVVIATLVVGVSTDAFAKKKAAGETASTTSAAAIDLNTADQKTLESLPGIGPVLAKAIIAGRPYKSIDDLNKVKGISASKLKAIKGKVAVGAAAAAPASALSAAGLPAAVTEKAASAQKQVTEKASKSASKLAPGQRVNINSASKEELEMIPGIGPAKSQAIIDGRPYNTAEDIMKVKGIKQGIFNKIKDYITVR
jgi:competence protein ComEA